MKEPIKSDRLATLLGASMGLVGFLVVIIAMLAPISDHTKDAAIASTTVIASAGSLGVSRSNKVLEEKGGESDENGQP